MALVLALSSAGVAGSLGERAMQCAAFDYGNWDYEVENFSPDDRSDGWKDQAKAFSAIAIREGVAASKVDSYIKRYRGGMKAMITDFVQRDDAKSRKTHSALSRECGKIIRKEPEMAAFR